MFISFARCFSSTNVHNFCLQLLFITYVHNSWSQLMLTTMIHNFCSQLWITNFFQNFYLHLFSWLLLINFDHNFLFPAFVYNFCSQLLLTILAHRFKLRFTAFVHNFCSQLKFKILFTIVSHTNLGNIYAQNICLIFFWQFYSKLIFKFLVHNFC